MSDAPAAANAEDLAAAQLKPAGSGKLIGVMVAVNTVVMVGVVALVLVRGSGHAAPPPRPEHGGEEATQGEEAEPQEEAGAAKKGLAGPTVKLDDFVVRLRNPDSDRFARVSFEIEVAGERDKERLVASMARVRDGFIGELTDRTVEELRGTEGLSTIKTSLSQKLKELVPNVRVRGLYVTDFIVQ